MKGWHKTADLRRLDEALMALAETNEDIMSLSEFDGFCTGLILCPEMIPPSQWLKEVWGGTGEPQFESPEAFQAALDLIMGHYNRVACMLTTPASYGPVMRKDRTSGQALFGNWVEGFVQSIRLRPSGWQRITESGDQEAATAFSLLLENPLIGTGTGSVNVDQQAQLLEAATCLIPDLVLALNRFTKSLPMERPATYLPFAANIPSAPSRAG